MPGEPDLEYVAARRALLDALEALAEHRDSIIVVGAQAVYLRTGAAKLTVAEFTTDADLAIDPTTLRPDPRLDAALVSSIAVSSRTSHSPASTGARTGSKST